MQKKLINLYSLMLKIRLFEEKILELFSSGLVFGTTHTYIGQEANAVGIISNLTKNDYLVSSHRCHGHYIAYTKSVYKLFCEIMGKKDGMCGGIGGSQHICENNFFSNGVQGGILPLSTGLAYAIKSDKQKISCVFIGDGTTGQGVLYECLNIISKWHLPILIVLENNQYAQSTHISKTIAGSFFKRFEAFDIKTTEISSFNVIEIDKTSSKIIKEIRSNRKPQCLIVNTYRFASHSKSDDGRDQEEIKQWLKKDPIKIIKKLIEKPILDKIDKKIRNEINKSCDKAIKSSAAI